MPLKPSGPAGRATSSTAVAATAIAIPIAGLAPFTTYHYKLIAQRGTAVYKGRDRTFKTKRQPLGVSLAGNPNPTRTGAAGLYGYIPNVQENNGKVEPGSELYFDNLSITPNGATSAPKNPVPPEKK